MMPKNVLDTGVGFYIEHDWQLGNQGNPTIGNDEKKK